MAEPKRCKCECHKAEPTGRKPHEATMIGKGQR